MNRVAAYRWSALLEVGLLVSLLVVGPRTPTALANPAAVLRGVHGIYATESNSITLASETVVIELLDGGTRSKARCEFHLRNETVRNEDLQLGFPVLCGPPSQRRGRSGRRLESSVHLDWER